MTFRFRRTVRLGPLRLNLSKRGLSSISLRALSTSLNVPVARRGGTRVTTSLRGTGMSWTTELPKAKQNQSKPIPSMPEEQRPAAPSPPPRAAMSQESQRAIGIAAGAGFGVLVLVGTLTAIYNTLTGAPRNDPELRLLKSCNAGQLADCEKVPEPQQHLIHNPAYVQAQFEAENRASQEKAQQEIDARHAAWQQKEARTYRAPLTSRSPSTQTPSAGGGTGYIRGPKGGCYTITASGEKRYVDRDNCL